MSLSDGRSKMSKSDSSDLSRINLLDSPDLIQKKIKRCKTDSLKGLEFDNKERPECNNLLNLYTLLSEKTKQEVFQECHSMGWGQFKPLLIDATVEALKPIQEKYHRIIDDKYYLDSVLKEGKNRAETIANETLTKVKHSLGYLSSI